jgi:hypothetical protein
MGEDWSPAERLPDTVNSDRVDQEPWIKPDGNTQESRHNRISCPHDAHIFRTEKGA